MMYKCALALFTCLLCAGTCLLCGESLTFDEAVARAFLYSPDLKIAASEIDGKTGLQTQSLLFPNPVVSYSVENVLGSKKWHGWSSAETRYEVAQLIELGGKRGYRYNLACYQKAAAEAAYDAKKLVVLNRLLKAFIDVAFAQEQLTLAQEQQRVADEVFKTVSAKVEAGKVSFIQQNKADIALASARIIMDKAAVDFEKAKERLSILLGSACPTFDRVNWDFYALDVPVAYDTCRSCLQEHPALIQAHLESLAANQILNLEKAEAVPDVVLSVGYKTELRNHEKGIMFGAAVPLPIFNQNQGNVDTERSRVQQSQDQYTALQLFLENRLSTAHKELLRAYREANQLRMTLLKTAEQSFHYAQDGYREGKFEYLDMLDSQRTLFDIKEQYIQALQFYHHSKADIEYLNSQDE